MSSLHEKFVNLGSPRRIWAVAAINGDHERLMALHDHLATRFNVRDRLVYLGNYIGMGAFDNRAVLEELLAFRSALLAKSGMEPNDIVHLRGPAEEAWQRLLRLQFSPAPTRALERYLEFGAESYLRLYGVSLNDTKSMARAGSVAITRWTNQLRMLQRETPGHEAFVCSFRRAALAATPDDKAVLFVPAGYDGSRILEDQEDNLWFSRTSFALPADNQTISRIVRGFDAMRRGVQTEGRAVTLDAGAGRGGPLVCGCFNVDGQLLEMIAVGGKGAVESSRFEHVSRPAMPIRSVPQIGIIPPSEQPSLFEGLRG
ncbi:MAG: hypothetical protein AB7S81_02380 [Bdellovibrionales bacterium]